MLLKPRLLFVLPAAQGNRANSFPLPLSQAPALGVRQTPPLLLLLPAAQERKDKAKEAEKTAELAASGGKKDD